MLFDCQALLVAREGVAEGYNWHVGLLNKNASTYTAKDRIKQAFSEWQESEIQVSFHKAWASVCKLILQLDQSLISASFAIRIID
jgi:hypothetical protein